MISGIYSIRNIRNGKEYIGSSFNISLRFRTHELKLNRKIHINKHLQFAWNKYGSSSFQFHILELVETKNLLVKEQEYIDRLKPEYNISKYPSSPTKGLTWKLSDESRLTQSLAQRKISHLKKGIRISKETEFKKGNTGFWLGKKRLNMCGVHNPFYGKHEPRPELKNGKIVKCGNCGTKIYRAMNELKRSKSGEYFCSKHCANSKRVNNG